MRKVSLILLVAGLFLAPLLAGCATTQQSEQSIYGFTPEQLGKLGAWIQMHPERSDEILARNDLTRPKFEKAVRWVSSDPALSRRYRRSFEHTLNKQ